MPQPPGSKGSEGFATASLHPFGGTKDASSRQGDAQSWAVSLPEINLGLYIYIPQKMKEFPKKKVGRNHPQFLRSLGHIDGGNSKTF